MADRIELRGLRALGVHGALPEEQSRAQPFEVDLDVEMDLDTPARSDDLDDTLDYGALCDSTVRVIETERFNLLEALAGRIADVVLADDRVVSVSVTIRKVRPPVPVDLDYAGVTLQRSR